MRNCGNRWFSPPSINPGKEGRPRLRRRMGQSYCGWAGLHRVAAILYMNGVDRHRFDLCGWSFNHTDERESQHREAWPPRKLVGRMDISNQVLFEMLLKLYLYLLSIAKPTIGGIATPCRCPQITKSRNISTQPLTQPRLTQPT